MASVVAKRPSGRVARVGPQRVLPQWVAAGSVALVLGLVTARAASSPHRGILLLLAAIVPFALMLARDVRRVLIAAVVFDTAFQWDKNFGYNTAAANLGAIGGFQVSVTTLALAGLYLMWFAELAVRRRTMPSGLLSAALPLIVYVGFTTLSVVVAGNKLLSVFEIAMLVQTLLLFAYLAGTIRTRGEVGFLVTTLVASLFAEGLITLALPYVGSHDIVGLSTYTDPGGAQGGSRFGGTIGSPNTAASFFSLLIAPSVALLTANPSRRVRRLAIAGICAGVPALVLTLSRGGWVALVISLAFLTVVSLKRGWISPRIPIVAAIGLTLILLPFSGLIANRLTASDAGAASSRIPLIKLASSVVQDHPVLGVGVNNLGVVFPKYAGPQYDRAWIYTVHDKYLLVWAEAGAGALLAFLWFLWSTLRRGWLVWGARDPMLSPIALGVTAGIVGQMAHMTVDIFQSRAQVQLLWIMAALLVSMQSVLRGEQLEGEAALPRNARRG